MTCIMSAAISKSNGVAFRLTPPVGGAVSYFVNIDCAFGGSDQLLSEVCGCEVTTQLLLPTLLSLSTDNVANVRFNVAKSLLKLGSHLDDTSVAE